MSTKVFEFQTNVWTELTDSTPVSVGVYDQYPGRVYLAAAAEAPTENIGHCFEGNDIAQVILTGGDSLWLYAPASHDATVTIIYTE